MPRKVSLKINGARLLSSFYSTLTYMYMCGLHAQKRIFCGRYTTYFGCQCLLRTCRERVIDIPF